MTPIGSATYAELFSARWDVVYPKTEVLRRPPRQFGRRAIDFSQLISPTMPELGVLTIDGASLLGPNGWAFGEQDFHLAEHTWYGGSHSPAVELSMFPLRLIRGVCLSLASDWGAKNYGHFLLDCLPRLHLFWAAGYSLDQVDSVYLPEPPSAHAASLFHKLGIPKEKVVWADSGVVVRPERLMIPSFPGVRRNYPDWVPRFLAEMFRPPVPGPRDRRLYLRRKSATRKIQNEDALLDVLLDFGFEICEAGAAQDEAKMLSEARCVIGAHDAGLANLAFCQPGTLVIEIIPSDHIYPYYYTLADSARLRYGYMAGISVGHRPKGSFGPSPFDLRVDKETLRATLSMLAATSDLASEDFGVPIPCVAPLIE